MACGLQTRSQRREYCEAVPQAGTDSELIRFKHLDTAPATACMFHRGGYDQIPQTFAELYQHI